jgi:hypothetical protein
MQHELGLDPNQAANSGREIRNGGIVKHRVVYVHYDETHDSIATVTCACGMNFEGRMPVGLEHERELILGECQIMANSHVTMENRMIFTNIVAFKE